MQIITIKHLDGHVLATAKHGHCHPAVVPPGTDLRYADLRGVTLRTSFTMWNLGADRIYSPGWRLDGTDLTGADFTGADTREAIFIGATLTDANFSGARINWCQHDLMAALLTQAALAEPEHAEAPAHVLAHRGWLWEQFVENADQHYEWSMNVYRRFVQPGDRLPPCFGAPGVAQAIASNSHQEDRPCGLTSSISTGIC